MVQKVYGNTELRAQLAGMAGRKEVPHAQILIGPEGSGGLPVAIEYAREILKAFHPKGAEAGVDPRIDQWNYPDLHFSFPLALRKTGDKPKAEDFMESWKTFVAEAPYGLNEDWIPRTDFTSKKNWFIGIDEARNISHKMSLRAFEGGAKVLIMWLPERLNGPGANALLKLLEEPPARTFFILVTHRPDQVLATIMSRCTAYQLSPLSVVEIEIALVDRGVAAESAALIAGQAGGNLRKAYTMSEDDQDILLFQERFVFWVRTAFKAKKNKGAMLELLKWSEKMAGLDPGKQQNFLLYCSEVFRWALHQNYGTPLVGEPSTLGEDFDLRKFAPFVHEGNIEDIQVELERSLYHLRRYVNAKLVFSDLSVRLTRYMHRPALTA